jgi:predicted dinucleotide-binding enzyme
LSARRQEVTIVKIGIIGSGNIGGTAARLFAKAGHDVAVSNSRGPESLSSLAASIGSKARAATVEEAVAFGDVVLLALPWRDRQELPPAGLFAGKIVIDATNPYTPDGKIDDLGASSSSEELARQLPGARLVKAFNTIYFKHLASRGRTDLPLPERHVIFLAGDDAEAKAAVSRLIEEIGFAPMDTGSLAEGGRRQQPGSDIYNQPMTAADAQKILSAGFPRG